MNIFIDTSALAKWYVNESRSDEVEDFLRAVAPVYISMLSKIEMKSLLARRKREGHITAEIQARVIATFESDIAAGHLIVLPPTIEAFSLAESILGTHPEMPLATLDALRIGMMQAADIELLATSDHVMAKAAETLGVKCRTFF